MNSEVDGTTQVVECGGSDRLRGGLRASRSAVNFHVRLFAEHGAMVCDDRVGN